MKPLQVNLSSGLARQGIYNRVVAVKVSSLFNYHIGVVSTRIIFLLASFLDPRQLSQEVAGFRLP